MGVAQTLSLISSMGSGGGATDTTTTTPTPTPTNTASGWGDMSTAGKTAAVGIGAMGLLGLAGNAMSLNSSGIEANSLTQEGDLALSESLLEADRVAEDGRQFQATQKMKYVMSGVLLAGSPIAVLDDTAEKVQEQIKAIKIRGEAQKAIAYAKAAQTKNEGRAGFLSGMVSTGANMFTLYTAAKKGGLFDSTSGGSSIPDGTIVDSNAFDANLGYA